MTEHEYWKWMKTKAAENLSAITKRTAPEDEGGVKHHLAMVLKHGDCDEKAEAIGEATEWLIANMMCNLDAHKEGMPLHGDKYIAPAK